MSDADLAQAVTDLRLCAEVLARHDWEPLMRALATHVAVGLNDFERSDFELACAVLMFVREARAHGYPRGEGDGTDGPSRGGAVREVPPSSRDGRDAS